MIDSFETNEILIGLLRGKTSAKGGCYHEGDRRIIQRKKILS